MAAQLAICGGSPVIDKPFPAYNTIDENEKAEVMEVLDSGVLSAYVAGSGPEFFGGPKVKKLERAWEEYFGVKHAVSVNSATSGLLAAVAACDIGPGDEVLMSPVTMCGTTAAVLLNYAVPIFVDVDPRLPNIDPQRIEEKITERTKAIYVVNLMGHSCDMQPIMEIAKRHNLYVLEDNAQSPGATYDGNQAGCIGDIGVFSLNCHKTIQCGEGGVIVTDNDQLALKLQLIRNHGESSDKVQELSDSPNVLGYNIRMTELEAAVAYHQLQKLEMLNEWRVRLATHLTNRIAKEVRFIQPPYVASNCTHVYYVYYMLYDESQLGVPMDLFAEAVQAEGADIWPGFGKPLYQYIPVFKNKSGFRNTGIPFQKPFYHGQVSYDDGTCPVAEELASRALVTEVMRWPNTEDDMDAVVDAMLKVAANREELLSWASNRTAAD